MLAVSHNPIQKTEDCSGCLKCDKMVCFLRFMKKKINHVILTARKISAAAVRPLLKELAVSNENLSLPELWMYMEETALRQKQGG